MLVLLCHLPPWPSSPCFVLFCCSVLWNPIHHLPSILLQALLLWFPVIREWTRSRPGEANRTTSSAKRDEILCFSTWTPSCPWLLLEIPSIKIMNRTVDKGQPCWSPTCRSGLVSAPVLDQTEPKQPLLPVSTNGFGDCLQNGTRDLASTPPSRCVDSGGREHGPPQCPSRCHCCFPQERWSPPVEQWSLQSEHYQIPHPRDSKKAASYPGQQQSSGGSGPSPKPMLDVEGGTSLGGTSQPPTAQARFYPEVSD